MCHAADYEGDYTDEDGNLVGTCRAGICYPYNSDYMKTAVDTVQQARGKHIQHVKHHVQFLLCITHRQAVMWSRSILKCNSDSTQMPAFFNGVHTLHIFPHIKIAASIISIKLYPESIEWHPRRDLL